MQTIVKIEKDDMKIDKIGENYQIVPNSQFSIIFSKDALVEFSGLINDLDKEIMLKDPTPEQEIYKQEFLAKFIARIESMKEGKADLFKKVVDICVEEAGKIAKE